MSRSTIFRSRGARAGTALALAAALSLAACSSTPEIDPSAGAGAGAGSGANAGAGGVADVNSVEYFNVVVGDRVFFETDRFDLDAEAQNTLSRQAEWLLANPGVNATIEGHADERGTREYNLALGARRANAVEAYLVGQGVPAGRLRTVSFGKERPVALGSDPQAWAQNRRAVTVVAGAPAG